MFLFSPLIVIVAELQMHNAVYSNQGRPFSPSQESPFSPSQQREGPGRPFSPSRQDGPGRPFSPSRQDGPGRPFSPTGPGRPFSRSQQQQQPGPERPFPPSRQDGPPPGSTMSGVPISRPFPGDQRTQGSRTPGPVLAAAGAAAPPGGSPGLKPRVMPKPTLPSFLAGQLNTGQTTAQAKPQLPVATGAMSAPRYPQHQPMMGTQYVQQQHQPRVPMTPVQQQPQPRMGAASGAHYPGAAGAAPTHQQQVPFGGTTQTKTPAASGQGSQTVFGGTMYLPKEQQPQKEPMWMWSMKDMLPLSLQQNREFAPYSMPASPTSPGPDQWASQPYSLPTSPTPMSVQNITLAPPEERMNAASPVRQMAALFDNTAKQPQGSMQLIARKRLQTWKKPSVSLAGRQHLSPLDEPGRAYSPTRPALGQATSTAAPVQPTPSYPRVLSPSIEATSQPSRVFSPTRQIQQVPSSGVMSPTQQLHGGPPPRRVLSPTSQLDQQPDTCHQQQLRVFSPTRQLSDSTSQQQQQQHNQPLRVFSPTKQLQQQQGGGTPQCARVFSPTKQLNVAASPPTKKAGLGAQQQKQQQERTVKPSDVAIGRKTPTAAGDALPIVDRKQPYMMALQPPSILKQAREDKYKEVNKRIEEALSPKSQGQSQGHGVHFSDSTNFLVGGPVNRPITPYSHDKEPWKKPTTLLNKPVTPLETPTTPYDGLKWLFDRPTTPYDRPITPYSKGSGDRPTTPIYVQVDGFEKPTQRPVTPLDRPTTPATNPLVRPIYGKDRPTTPLDKPLEPPETKTSRGNYTCVHLSMEWN